MPRNQTFNQKQIPKQWGGNCGYVPRNESYYFRHPDEGFEDTEQFGGYWSYDGSDEIDIDDDIIGNELRYDNPEQIGGVSYSTARKQSQKQPKQTQNQSKQPQKQSKQSQKQSKQPQNQSKRN
jgi:hypothetical protein